MDQKHGLFGSGINSATFVAPVGFSLDTDLHAVPGVEEVTLHIPGGRLRLSFSARVSCPDGQLVGLGIESDRGGPEDPAEFSNG